MSGKCAVCEADALQQCTGCRSVHYCGKEHQKSHWKSHKGECRPVQVQEHPVLGRHLVATRDIAQGELIIRELPLITGPKRRRPNAHQRNSPETQQSRMVQNGIRPNECME